ncbi:hypothetical protein T484DRAFT_1838586 [Baffinella frigidus]|nr:hypothetical protein T484DRAFT_1838586 [Cryptophyta sp. CCMP2293]
MPPRKRAVGAIASTLGVMACALALASFVAVKDAGAETELLGAPCPLGPRVAPCYGGGPGYGGGPAWPGGGPGLQPASVASVAYQGSMPPSAQAEVNYLEGTVNDATDRLTALEKKMIETKADGDSSIGKLEKRKNALELNYEILDRKYKRFASTPLIPGEAGDDGPEGPQVEGEG